jgi:hypothetical protein
MPKPESHNEIRQALQSALPSEKAYIEDVFPDYVIYVIWSDTETTYWKAPYKFDDDGNAELGNPEKVTAKRTFEPVAFSANFSRGADEEELAIYSGKIFEFGDYADKKISFSSDDGEAASKTFAPVEVNLEHKKLPKDLSGVLGTLRKIWNKGKDLYGELAIPKKSADVIHEKVGDDLPVSVEISRVGPKQVIGIALTGDPRIEDALVAAFSNNSEPPSSENPAQPADKSHEVKPMSNQNQGSPEKTAEHLAAEARVKELEDREKARIDADRQRELAMVDKAGEAYADKQVEDKRILPTGALAAAFSMAVKDDNRDAPAHFSNTGEIIEGERVKQLKALVESFPVAAFAKTTNFAVLGNNDKVAADSADEIPIADGVLRHAEKNQ